MEDEKEYVEWKQEKRAIFSKIVKHVKPFHYFLLIILIVLFVAMLGNKEMNKPQYYLMGGIAIGGVIVWLITRAKTAEEIIKEHIAKKIAVEVLKRKIAQDKEFPIGMKIVPLPYCRLIFQETFGMGGKPTPLRWEVGVLLINPDGLEREVRVLLHPIQGYVLGIVGVKAGYDGSESKDRTYVMRDVGDMASQSFMPSSSS